MSLEVSLDLGVVVCLEGDRIAGQHEQGKLLRVRHNSILVARGTVLVIVEGLRTNVDDPIWIYEQRKGNGMIGHVRVYASFL